VIYFCDKIKNKVFFEGFQKSFLYEKIELALILTWVETDSAMMIASIIIAIIILILPLIIYFLPKINSNYKNTSEKQILSFLLGIFPYVFFTPFLWISFKIWIEIEDKSLQFWALIITFVSVLINIFLSLFELNLTFRNEDYLYRKKTLSLAIDTLEPLIVYASFEIFGE
jgi:uncharacterized protein YacL